MTTLAERVGKWDPALFARFRAAAGIRRKLLLEQLLRENLPLVKLLLDQLRGGERRAGIRALGGCAGFRDLEWEDAFQVAQMAFCIAIERYDPSKGGIATYAKLWIRNELQRRAMPEAALVRVTRESRAEAVPMALVGEQQDLDFLAGGFVDGVMAIEGIGPAQLAEWQATGEWPESLEEAREMARMAEEARRPVAAVIYSIPARILTGLERFFRRCSFGPSARADLWTAYNVYRIECREAGESELPRPRFVAHLRETRGVREVKGRTHRTSSTAGLSGLRVAAT